MNFCRVEVECSCNFSLPKCEGNAAAAAVCRSVQRMLLCFDSEYHLHGKDVLSSETK